MTGDNSLDRCGTCQHTRLWHNQNSPVHPFNEGQAGAAAFLGQRDRSGKKPAEDGSEGASRRVSAPRGAFPMDPVLRQALIDKGVLTPEDLRDAEDKIHAITGLFNQNGPTMRERETRG